MINNDRIAIKAMSIQPLPLLMMPRLKTHLCHPWLKLYLQQVLLLKWVISRTVEHITFNYLASSLYIYLYIFIFLTAHSIAEATIEPLIAWLRLTFQDPTISGMVLQYKGFDGLWKCLLNSKLCHDSKTRKLKTRHFLYRRWLFKKGVETKLEKQYYTSDESSLRTGSFKCKLWTL